MMEVTCFRPFLPPISTYYLTCSVRLIIFQPWLWIGMGVAQLATQLVVQRNAWYADECNISTAHAQLSLRATDLQNHYIAIIGGIDSSYPASYL